MPVKIDRGNVVLVPFPNTDLRSTKLRPALVVQSDHIDSELSQVILAMISSNLRRAGRTPRVMITKDTDYGKASGLLADSVVMTDNLATVLDTYIVRVIGRLPDMRSVDDALRHSLAL